MMRGALSLAAVALFLGAVALGVLAPAGSPVPSPASAAAAMARPVRMAGAGSTVDRTLRDSRITESSGLVASRRTPGVLWTHDDSGNPPVLYAVGAGGATVGTTRVSGVANVDWEAINPLTGPDGRRLLAIGDIGDNGAVRSRIEIDVIGEPAVTGNHRVRPVRVIRLRYPDGPADAETVLADPRNGRLYVVTKGLLSSTVYAVPASAWPGGAGAGRTVNATLQPVGRVDLTLVTDGAVLPDGRVLLRTYSTLAVLPPLIPPPAPGSGGSGSGSGSEGSGSEGSAVPTLTALSRISLPGQPQGEGLAVLDPAAGVLLLSSEGAGTPILRLTVPSGVWRKGAAPASASASATRPPSGAAIGSGTPGGDPDGRSAAPGGRSAAPDGTAGARAAAPGGAGAWLVTLAGAVAFLVLLVLARVIARLRGP